MRKLHVFNQITLDGYFSGPNGDISWAHKTPDDSEWNNFVAENATGGGELLFGRVTYDLMKSYWPTPEAMKNDPVVAEQMNSLPKVVFSRSLDKASWNRTRLVKGDLVAEVRRMKQEPGKTMVILGSGSIVSQLTQAGLIDVYQLVVNPIVIGKGRTMFEGVDKEIGLERTDTRSFKNGNVLVSYQRKQ